MNFIDWLIKKQQEEKQKQQQQQQQEAQAYDKIMSTGAGSEKYKAKKQVQQQNAKIKAQNDAIKKSNEKLQSDLAAEADKQGMNANEKMYYTQTQYMQRENKTKVPYKTMRDYRSNQIDFVDKDLGEIMKNDPEAQKKIEAGNALNVYLNGGQTYDESIALGEGWKDTYMTQFRDSLSPEELKKLSYLLGEQQLNKTDHAQTIKDYTKTIEYRAGQAHEDKKYASGDYKTGNFYANSAAQGAVSGTIGGFNKFIKRLSGDITPTVMLAEEKAYQKELSEAKGFKRIAGLTINSAAQMATSGGTGGMFASVAGNTYDQSRKQGYNDSESLTYALINAGMETVTTKLGGKMLGGYKGFVKGVPEIKETISKVVKNPIAQRCAFLITDMGAEGVEETLQTAFDPLIRNTVFKENNNLVLSGKDYLESFLVGALSVGALHAKSTAIGLSSDVIGSIYKMKNSKGQHLPNETVKAYLLNNATDSDIQKIDTWGKDIKAEDIDKMTDDLGRIASAKIGSLTYGDISKATAKMDKGQVIDFYYQVMNSPEYKSQTEEMKKQSAVAMDEGEGVKVNTTLDNLKSNIEITDNTLNKTVSNINENTNKEDVINNETLTSSQNNSIDTDSGISENSQVINDAADNVKTDNQANNTGINAEGKTNYSIINQESQNNAVGNENSIANGDGMGYKGGEGNLYSQDFEIPEDILKTKPQNSRIPKGWFDIGGKISVDKNNTWTYIGSQNQTVTYNNNYADFKGSGYVKQEVNIGEFKSRPDDCRRANKLAPNGPKSPDSVWHHNEDEQTMQEINKIIHEMFTHKGGFSKMKKNK